MITHDPKVVKAVRRLRKHVQAPNTEFDEYSQSYPFERNLSTSYSSGGKNFDSKYRGKVTPARFDNPLNSLIRRIPFFRRIQCFPHDGVGMTFFDRSEMNTALEAVRASVERMRCLPDWDGNDTSVINKHNLIPAVLMEPKVKCIRCQSNGFACVFSAPGALSSWTSEPHIISSTEEYNTNDPITASPPCVVASVEMTSCLCCRYPAPSAEQTDARSHVPHSRDPAPLPCQFDLQLNGIPTSGANLRVLVYDSQITIDIESDPAVRQPGYEYCPHLFGEYHRMVKLASEEASDEPSSLLTTYNIDGTEAVMPVSTSRAAKRSFNTLYVGDMIQSGGPKTKRRIASNYKL